MAIKAQGLTAAKASGKKSAALRREQAEKQQRFRAAIVERFVHVAGRQPDAFDEAHVDCACALYGVVLPRASLTGGVNRKVNLLALSAVITGLRSVLRELGLVGTAIPDPNTPPGPGATPEERREWSQRYVESLVEGERISS